MKRMRSSWSGLTITIVLAMSTLRHWEKIIEKIIHDGSRLFECRALQIKDKSVVKTSNLSMNVNLAFLYQYTYFSNSN